MMNRLRLLPPAALLAAALLVSGCTAPPTATTPSGAAPPAAPPAPGPVSTNVRVVDGVQVVAIELSEFAITPDVTLNPGKVKFVVTNKGVAPHEFVLYSEAQKAEAVAAHKKAMAAGGDKHGVVTPGVLVDIENIDAGKTQESPVIELRAGTYEAGCHIPGHYEAGMKGKIVVQGAAPATATSAPSVPKTAAAGPYTGPSADVVRRGDDVPPPITRKEPATVRIDLEVREVVGEMADGVHYRYWTYNGTVPGPMLRVREGDTVEFHLKNAADSTQPHSIDLHAVTGPGGGAVLTQAKPGEERVFTFKAVNPGIYIYHCATPHIPSHVANGLYGMILVEPKEGLPSVDREFYVVQGEWYTEGKRGEKGLQPFSGEKMQLEHPEYVTFNGKVAALTGANALKAKVGERVRIYVGVGAFLPSSFHVIGEIFDKVYPEGALKDPIRDVQTTTVPAGGAAAVEFALDVPGRYILVDHSLTRALDKGAVGFIEVEGPENPAVYKAVTPGGTSAAGH
ncbi:MAG: copper-containing nitrite reductase [Halobacteria archaeon]